MFDLAWSEIALIGVVALVVIGPKDLPEAIRGVAKGVQKLRRMASEFQSQADELVREAKLDEVRNQINEVKSAVNDIRNFDLRSTVEKHVDGDGVIRSTFESDPFKTTSDWTPPPVTEPSPSTMEGARAGMPEEAPAFVPPEEAAKQLPVAAAPFVPPPAPEPPAPPAFVPPATEPPPVTATVQAEPTAMAAAPAAPPVSTGAAATPHAAPVPAPATEKA